MSDILPDNFQLDMPNRETEDKYVVEDAKLDKIVDELTYSAFHIKQIDQRLFQPELSGKVAVGRTDLPTRWRNIEGFDVPVYGATYKSLGREKGVLIVDKDISFSNQIPIIYLITHELMHHFIDRGVTVPESNINQAGAGLLKNVVRNYGKVESQFRNRDDSSLEILNKNKIGRAAELMEAAQKLYE